MYENAKHVCGNCLSSLFCSCCSGSPFQLPRYPYIFHLIYFDLSIERRSRYVTLSWQQNFWMTTNRKRHLKSEFALLQTSSILSSFHLIWQMLATFSQVESERTYPGCQRLFMRGSRFRSSLRSACGRRSSSSHARKHLWYPGQKGPYLSLEKEKDNFCVVFTYSIKQACEIRKERNSVMHVQICCFVNRNLLLFCHSPSIAVVVGFVVIQKQCYHGDVTSHFSSPLIISFQPRPQGVLVFHYWRTRRPWGRG